MSGAPRDIPVLTHSFPTRRSSDLPPHAGTVLESATRPCAEYVRRGPANPDTRKRNDRVVTQDAPSPFTMPSPPVRRVDRRECDQCAAGGVEGGPQPEDQSMAIPARAAPRSRQPGVRDPRLDFFRGGAIGRAHVGTSEHQALMRNTYA